MKNSELCIILMAIYGSEIFGPTLNTTMGLVSLAFFAAFAYLESRK